jgi:response regulator RpfG family c-di-GMP phosphodiesterase
MISGKSGSTTIEPNSNRRNMRTLILIDNNKDDLQFMKEAISSVDSSIQSLSFIYAEEAMTALLHDLVVKPDTIFINVNMPAKMGLKCFLELRSIEAFNDVPVVVYAPKITSEIVESLKDSGATLTFERPATMRGWKDVINEILNSVNQVDNNSHYGAYESHAEEALNK